MVFRNPLDLALLNKNVRGDTQQNMMQGLCSLHLTMIIYSERGWSAQDFAGGSLAGGDGAVHGSMVSFAIRRFASKEQGIRHRRGEFGLCAFAANADVAIRAACIGIELPVVHVPALQHPFQSRARKLEYSGERFESSIPDE